jgi:hypothetical protein
VPLVAWVVIDMAVVASTKLLKSEAIGKAVGISVWTVHELYKKGIIPGIKVTRRALRFDLQDVLRALKARAQTEGDE